MGHSGASTVMRQVAAARRGTYDGQPATRLVSICSVRGLWNAEHIAEDWRGGVEDGAHYTEVATVRGAEDDVDHVIARVGERDRGDHRSARGSGVYREIVNGYLNLSL